MEKRLPDGLVLTATILSGGDAETSLEEVVASADFIQHAIITFEELEGALARLSAAGLLRVSGAKVQATESALVVYRDAKRHSVIETQREMEKALEAEPWKSRSVVSSSALTAPLYEAAVKAYLSRE